MEINTKVLNESIKEDLLELQNMPTKERLVIDIENNKEIVLRKKLVLEQALDLLNSAIVYGELDREKGILNESIANCEDSLILLEEDLIQIEEME